MSSNFKLPKIHAVKPRLLTQDIVTAQPFFCELLIGQTYLAKKIGLDRWETCTMKDITDPNYKPFLAIPSRGGYAIWDAETEKPIVCTDREIFKKFEISPEKAVVSDKNTIFREKGHQNGLNSSIFYFKSNLASRKPNKAKMDWRAPI